MREKKYLIINNRDPNDSFEVLAIDDHEACIIALSELGWNISTPFIEEDDDEDG
jgi:hypothetical protein